MRQAWAIMAGIGLVVAAAAGAAKAPETPAPRMSFLDDDVIRLGVNLDLGGAITYLAAKGGENLVNNHDWGRQIQMSHYGGPVPYVVGDKQPAPEWKNLGWNPIQSGDFFGNRSKVLEHSNDGRTLYVKCVPMHWPLNNVPGECTFETWIALRKNTAEVRCRMVNARPDKTQYPGRNQELPAVYTNGPYYRLLTYTGSKPFTGDALATIPPQFPWAHWQATENWAALVRDDDFGLGIWAPRVQTFDGGFYGKPGKGDERDAPTGYIAPRHREIIDYNIQYEFEYVLIVGNLQAIRKYVYDRAPRSRVPEYRFAKDRQHWIYSRAADAGWPIRGELNVTLDQGDPQLIGPAGCWPAAEAPRLLIHAAFKTQETEARVFWTRFGETGFPKADSAAFPVIGDGQYRVYEVDLAAQAGYKGLIAQLRLNPVPRGHPGEWVRIKSITFRRP